jgi:hypothetical protein
MLCNGTQPLQGRLVVFLHGNFSGNPEEVHRGDARGVPTLQHAFSLGELQCNVRQQESVAIADSDFDEIDVDSGFEQRIASSSISRGGFRSEIVGMEFGRIAFRGGSHPPSVPVPGRRGVVGGLCVRSSG